MVFLVILDFQTTISEAVGTGNYSPTKKETIIKFSLTKSNRSKYLQHNSGNYQSSSAIIN